ncbi:ABC transporter ATP-binding protein [Methylocapsa sp. S129]|uniref:ABC transporter ATP-binding protein n=1 Tax=Methylocapsa sp. S129 TaxID=1641869 RepID=UPI00131A7A03|nr:ABC transporter ATP-binding protein [Methylocapsa sp. S129]
MSEPIVVPLLRLRNVAKSFGDKVALSHVDLDVEAGEVHVICGENGAGKSTLMNILAGILQPDAGEMLLDGKSVRFSDPIEAGRVGIGMVHQHFKLVSSMSVAENLFLNRQPLRFGFISDRRVMRERAQTLIARYRFDLDPDASIAQLSVGQRQRVEILKALAFDARILILDEPTAVLTPPEVSELLGVIADLKARGRTILFITHKLKEVKAASDRVTVLRHGASVSTRPTAGLSESDIAHDMVGRDLATPRRRAGGIGSGAPKLSLSGLTMTNASGRRLLDEINLDIRAGEIVGVAGVDGNGQTELSEAVAGLQNARAGAVAIDGKDATNVSPHERRARGLGFIPEDRLDRGLCAGMTIAENVSTDNYAARKLTSCGLIRMAARDAFASEKIRQFDIRGARPGLPVGQLSGGNMQKVVIAREMEKAPNVLVVAQPTRGLDVGAAEFVHGQILAAADRGCAVLLISSELSEIFALSDRIAVMYRGAVLRVLDRTDATEHLVGLLMNGVDEAA